MNGERLIWVGTTYSLTLPVKIDGKIVYLKQGETIPPSAITPEAKAAILKDGRARIEMPEAVVVAEPKVMQAPQMQTTKALVFDDDPFNFSTIAINNPEPKTESKVPDSAPSRTRISKHRKK